MKEIPWSKVRRAWNAHEATARIAFQEQWPRQVIYLRLRPSPPERVATEAGRYEVARLYPYHRPLRTVFISPHTSRPDLIDTICHELAHVIAGLPAAHGRNFRLWFGRLLVLSAENHLERFLR